MLAYLYRAPDGLFVNLEILRQGYTPLDTLHLSKHKEVFGRWEKVAKEKRKGLWGATVVYVTETGHKYHRESCRYLRQSCEPITLEDARKRYGPRSRGFVSEQATRGRLLHECGAFHAGGWLHRNRR